MHGIAYNPVDDEIIVPNPVAASILVFRGGAEGAEPPVRVIQGARTKLAYPHSVNVDVKNREIIVGDPGGRKILVFPLDANGDAPPLRVLQGPKTTLGYVVGIAVDPERDLLIASSSTLRATFEGGSNRGLLIFNRTDNGDVAPRAAISGPKTGVMEGAWQVQVDSERGLIFMSVGNVINYRPRYGLDKLRDWARTAEIKSPWGSERLGFVGVWGIADSGDVAPMFAIRGPVSNLVHPAGLAINPLENEIIVTDSVRNSTMVFSVPEIFKSGRTGASRAEVPGKK